MNAKVPLLALTALVLSPMAVWLTGCTSNKPPDPNQVREKTAETTAELRDNAKAVVEGIKEGLDRPSPGVDHPLDLNTASKGELTSLPGVTDDQADRIIAGRPYSTEHDLLDRRIVSRDEYRRIAASVVVKNRPDQSQARRSNP